MALTVAQERRALSNDEFELVLQARYPRIDELAPDELRTLARQLREARAQARDAVRARRRQSKKDSGGAGQTTPNGPALKKQIFANALKRVNRRLNRIGQDRKRAAHIEAAHRALQRKEETENNQNRPSAGRTKGKGMRVVGNTKPTVGINPMERGRVSQFVRNAQARRDQPA